MEIFKEIVRSRLGNVDEKTNRVIVKMLDLGTDKFMEEFKQWINTNLAEWDILRSKHVNFKEVFDAVNKEATEEAREREKEQTGKQFIFNPKPKHYFEYDGVVPPDQEETEDLSQLSNREIEAEIDAALDSNDYDKVKELSKYLKENLNVLTFKQWNYNTLLQ